MAKITNPEQEREQTVLTEKPREHLKGIDFNGDCVNSAVKSVLLDSFNFALEQATARLDRLGKIYPDIGEAGETVLKTLGAMLTDLEHWPICDKGEYKARMDAVEKERQAEWDKQRKAEEAAEKKEKAAKTKAQKKAMEKLGDSSEVRVIKPGKVVKK